MRVAPLGDAVSPASLIEELSDNSESRRLFVPGGVQQDASEMLRTLLEVAVEAPCGMELSSLVHGECKHTSRMRDGCTVLELKLRPDTKTLARAIEFFTFPEIMEGESMYACSQCGGVKVVAAKTYGITSTSELIVISLPRFSHDNTGPGGAFVATKVCFTVSNMSFDCSSLLPLLC